MDTAANNIVGREKEEASLAGWLSDRDVLPSAFILEGEAGIGKTTLWRRGIELASEAGFRVLSCSPSESEVRLSFTGLGDLLEPVLDEVLELLPKPQRHALKVALAMEEERDHGPDPRAISLAFLGAMRALSHIGPLAIAIDDLQWLDELSALAIGFAIRRLRDERIAVLCALRSGETRPQLALDRAFHESRLRRVVVGPLSLGAVHRLLSDRLGLVLPRPRLRRLLELSGGNPFYALELGRAVERGVMRIEEGEPLPGTLAALVQDRLATLTPKVRACLLLVATPSHPTLDLVGRALGADPAASLASALEANVIELLGDRIHFTHPLYASAVYASAGEEKRRALHRRLAGLVADPDEQAHHLALGTEGPDEGVAAALEDAAGRAHLRGAVAAAAELSEHARRLTPTDLQSDRHRRTIQAASRAFEAGEGVQTRVLLEEALAEAPPGRWRAEIRFWLGHSYHYEGDRRLALEFYRSALAEAGNDLSLQAALEGGIADALFLMRADLPAAAEHALSAVAYAERSGDRSAQIKALGELGLTDAIVGGGEWRHALAHGVALEGQGEPVRLGATASFCLAVNLTWVDEFDEARKILRALRERADETAEDGALPWILANLSLVEFLAGRWGESSLLAQEAYDVALQVDQEPQRLFALGVRAVVHASQGDAESAREDAAGALELTEERGMMIATILACSALGLLELSLGHFESAHDVLGPLVERLEDGGVREPGSARFIPDDVEALIGLVRLEEAERLLVRLERRARRLERVSALAAAGRCRGLLQAARGDLDAALESLGQAMVQHERLLMPFERARTLLVLGATRRRARMKRPARDALEESVATFESLGARLWAERARIELARIGGRRESTGVLTPTEQRIAELVAEGHTDKEIAATLFVTPKTVGTQLSRIYRKLGVRSRTGLAVWLRSVDADGDATATKE